MLHEWATGKEIKISFSHDKFKSVYDAMLRAMYRIEQNPYQASKLANTRQSWAHIGMCGTDSFIFILLEGLLIILSSSLQSGALGAGEDEIGADIEI